MAREPNYLLTGGECAVCFGTGVMRRRDGPDVFDVPPAKTERLAWTGIVPLEAESWQIGLIVGPSGSGKSTLLRGMFGETSPLEWRGAAVIEDFDAGRSLQEIADVCGAVGFNTIPAWRRPFAVLSNGERFRVELARRLLESDGLVTMDEFTSVVDRQVARIGAHAVQRYIRKDLARRFVAASCHYDVLEWLRPDWILEPHEMRFEWTTGRWLRRPQLNVTVGRVPYSAWSRFAPYHYMTAELHRGAQCFGLWVESELAAFLGVIHMPHATRKNIKRGSRVVILPDYQGLSLVFAMIDPIAAAYRALGYEFRGYPAHPGFVRAFVGRSSWRCVRRPGTFSPRMGQQRTRAVGRVSIGRSPAAFAYCGPALPDRKQARALICGDGPQSELPANWARVDRTHIVQDPCVAVERPIVRGASASKKARRDGQTVHDLGKREAGARERSVWASARTQEERASVAGRPAPQLDGLAPVQDERRPGLADGESSHSPRLADRSPSAHKSGENRSALSLGRAWGSGRHEQSPNTQPPAQ